MSVELSEMAADAMLDGLARLMDGGTLEMWGDGKRLAVLKLGNPAAQPAVGGALDLNPIGEEDAALTRGQAAMARILTSEGGEVLACDVGDQNSDAVIRLNTTSIFSGGPVRIRSFTLAMP